MSVFLYVLAALAVMAGTAMIAIGIPIKEFGIGNTLMLAGTFALCSGLVVLGLAMVLAQLSRLAEMLSIRPALRDARAAGPYERPEMSSIVPPADAARIPFPPRPKPHGDKPQADRTQSELRDSPPPAAAEPAGDAPAMAHPALSLRNPVLTPGPEATVRETTAAALPPLSPPPPRPAESPAAAESAAPPAPPFPPFDAGRKPSPPIRPPQSSYFDTMWPPENRPVKKSNGDAARAPARFEPPPAATDHASTEPAAPPSEPAGEAQASVILKSGVVDGMAYTLYVDGSIEAELPHGTLRFASINELRAHLEKGA